MKLRKEERKLLKKDYEVKSYPSEINRADKWTRGGVYKNKKAYDRNSFKKETKEMLCY